MADGDRVSKVVAGGADGAAPPYSAVRVEVARLPGGGRARDAVAVEEPLEIRIGGEPVAVTMRTPGHDEELALGFCLSEGLVPEDATPTEDFAANTVEVRAPAFDPGRLRRSFYTTSSCGVCGKGALEAVARGGPPGDSPPRRPAGPLARPPGAAAPRAGRVRRDRRPPRDRPLPSRRGAVLRPRGRRPPQRDGKGRRLGV